MTVAVPNYTLTIELGEPQESGRWRFRLQRADGSTRLEAADVEPAVRGQRLELLTVVRALEALDQPSRVWIEGCSRHLRHGLEYGLPEWRENDWRWEWFGQMVPVKNHDLWQRLEHALRFHDVHCRTWRLDGPHDAPRRPLAGAWSADGAEGVAACRDGRIELRGGPAAAVLRRRVRRVWHYCHRRFTRLSAALAPCLPVG